MSSKYEIHTLVLGPLETNAVVIDPADQGEAIWKMIENNNWELKQISITHGHFDHIGGVSLLRELSQAPVAIHGHDAYMLKNPNPNLASMMGDPVKAVEPDLLFHENDSIPLGDLGLNILHTPGHSPGSVSFLGDDFVIVGDTLFRDSIGRTDLPGGSQELLLKSIRDKFLKLDDNYSVFPGHGPATTIGNERKGNPFLAGDQYDI